MVAHRPLLRNRLPSITEDSADISRSEVHRLVEDRAAPSEPPIPPCSTADRLAGSQATGMGHTFYLVPQRAFR